MSAFKRFISSGTGRCRETTNVMTIGKPVALILVPNRRLFRVGTAAQCLGKAIGTIRKLAELNLINARAELDTAGWPPLHWRT